MSLLSADVGPHAPGHKMTHAGRTFEFRHLGHTRLTEWERERYRIARESLRELREDYGEPEYLKRLDELRRRWDLHEFAFENDKDFRDTRDGVLLTLRVMTGATADEALDLLLANPHEVASLMALVVQESFPKAEPAESPQGNPPAPR